MVAGFDGLLALVAMALVGWCGRWVVQLRKSDKPANTLGFLW